MQREHGLVMHITIAPTRDGANVTWFLNTRLLGAREFVDWADAIAWSDRIRDQNWAVGWRLTPDADA
jgi:hypothetical protein